MREELIEAVGSFKFPIESCGCTIGEYIVPYSIQEPLVDHLIASGVVVSILETTTKWIPVTDRLPGKNMKCLCSYVFNENTEFHFEQVLYYIATCENPHFQHEGELGLKVTHWMPMPPLPEPPKGE